MTLSRSEPAGAREGSRRAAHVFRRAWPDDADQIASLHADSWRRHYRGAYSDSFLDGDVVTDRRSVWSARLEAPKRSVTILAEEDKGLVGFIHVVLDDDPKWGSLVDNLHVVQDRRRIGIGGELLGRAAQAICGGTTNRAMFLWVLQQNTAAQHFVGVRPPSGANFAAVEAWLLAGGVDGYDSSLVVTGGNATKGSRW